MTYATAQDMIDRFREDRIIQLTDSSEAGAIDEVVLGRALVDADAEINSHLTRYKLPLASIPPLLTRIAADLAIFQLYGERLTEAVKTRRDNAAALLKSIANGTVSLGLDPVSQPVQEVGGVAFVAARRVFSADSLADYR